jgi:hypothetical protein
MVLDDHITVGRGCIIRRSRSQNPMNGLLMMGIVLYPPSYPPTRWRTRPLRPDPSARRSRSAVTDCLRPPFGLAERPRPLVVASERMRRWITGRRQAGVKKPRPHLCLFFQCFPAAFAECERQAKLSVGVLDQRPITSARMKSAAPPIDQPSSSMEQRQEERSKTIGKYKKGLETCYEQKDVELRHVQRQGREKRE